MGLRNSDRRIVNLIGAAALAVVAISCVYNFVDDWPSQFRGGVVYERAVREHLATIPGYALIVAAFLAIWLFQMFGYDRALGGAPGRMRRWAANAAMIGATLVASGALVSIVLYWLLRTQLGH